MQRSLSNEPCLTLETIVTDAKSVSITDFFNFCLILQKNPVLSKNEHLVWYMCDHYPEGPIFSTCLSGLRIYKS